MPIVHPPAKVLVSGANGFIATWIIKSLLDQGYVVRGAVRSQDKAEPLKQVFAEYGDKLEFVIVEDLSKEGAFDEAVKDVDAIEHTASPVTLHGDDPQDLIGPAVNGTLGMLKSAQKCGHKVKRVVLTSSVAAVTGIPSNPPLYTEADWSESSIKEVNEKGRNADRFQKYKASKTLAEKAAWDFYNKNKASLNWDLVVLNPPFVYGPTLNPISSPKELSSTNGPWYDIVVKRSDSPELPDGSFIDVRDVADLHVLSLSTEAAGGERILISAAPYTWQDWRDTADGKEVTSSRASGLDTSKAKKIFNFKYKTMAETTKDMMDDFKARGW